MSAERPSLLDDDSDYYGEDSVRLISGYRPNGRKIYLSPDQIRYEPGQVRSTVTEHSIYYPGQDTPIKKMTKAVATRLTPLHTRLRQCKALIRPLHSRYYPFCIAFYILIAAVVSCYFFGATPTKVSETVLDPMVSSVSGAVSGMTEKVGDAFVSVRESVGDVYSGVKERIKDGLERHSASSGESSHSNATRLEREEREKRIEELITKEFSKVWAELESMRETQEVYVDWSNRMNKKFAELHERFAIETSSLKNRLESFDAGLQLMKMDYEHKMRSLMESRDSSSPSSTPSSPSPSILANHVTMEEFKMHLEGIRQEFAELRRMIPVEEVEPFINLAAYTNGAAIIDSATSFSLYSTFFNIFSTDRAPLYLITERQLFPGDCMPLPATGGSVGIRLSTPGHISHIEYYHLYWSEAGGIPLSAPKKIKITGCSDNDASEDCEELTEECEYTVESTVGRREEAKRRRVFGVPAECSVKKSLEDRVIRSIKMEVESNHGAEHICLYLVRVLGKAVE